MVSCSLWNKNDKWIQNIIGTDVTRKWTNPILSHYQSYGSRFCHYKAIMIEDKEWKVVSQVSCIVIQTSIFECLSYISQCKYFKLTTLVTGINSPPNNWIESQKVEFAETINKIFIIKKNIFVLINLWTGREFEIQNFEDSSLAQGWNHMLDGKPLKIWS